VVAPVWQGQSKQLGTALVWGRLEKMRVDEFSNFYEAERFSILEEHSQIPPLTTASIKHR
jgi:hypothetical protein